MNKPDCLEKFPSKIVAVGLNYRKHAEELNLEVPKEPLLFLKATSSLIAHQEEVIIPPESDQVEYEAELALIIGKTAYRVSRKKALDYVEYFTCLNDITARDLQWKDGQWCRAKSFNTFCPIGPRLVKDLDPDKLEIKLRVNGELKQDSHTSDFIFPPDQVISYISQVMTLFPGDIITTGTPPGVGRLKPGDQVEVEIAEVGILSNPVIAMEGD